MPVPPSRPASARPAPRLPVRWLVALAALLGAVRSSGAPEVDVTGGRIRGRALAEGGAVFRGIPFAAPPVGRLRWRAPQPVVPWTGVRDALQPGAPPPQENFGWNDVIVRAAREDCLYLDVWAPPPRAEPYPVMVWIHGGANIGLRGGTEPSYEGTHLVARGVVLVVLEYRVGALGFFAHPDLAREDPELGSGNYALLDQLAALRWVQANIGRFGGAPGNVTFFGQSAGGWNITALMSSPLARGLFHRAILQSGVPPANLSRPRAETERDGVAVAAKLGAPKEGALDFLRRLPPEELLKAAPGCNAFTIGGAVLPEPPAAVWRRGGAMPVPILIGGNAIEFPAKGTLAEIRQSIRDTLGDLAPAALAYYGADRDTEPAPDPVYGDVRDQWGSDQFFRVPAIVYATWQHAAGRRCWLYEFDRATAPHPRVEHSTELAYMFGNFLKGGGMVAGDYDATDRRLSDRMIAYWTNFARQGDPNGPDLPAWPGFDAADARFLRFTRAGEVVPDAQPRGPLPALFQRWMEASLP